LIYALLAHIRKKKKKGALTNKRESFKYRPWEFKSLETIDITDSLTTNIFINKKESKIFRILPKKNSNLIKSIITNNARYSYDALSLNRLYNIFNIVKKKLYKTSFETIEKLFGNFIIQKKILFFINDRSNLILINKLKFLSILQKNIEIFSMSNFYNFKNVYKYYKNSKHYLKTNTFLLGLSLNTELPVLWSKILFHLSPYNSFFYTTCNNIKEFEDKSMFNLQNSDIIELYEGKKKIFSNSLKTMQILFGEAFQKRWTNTSFVFKNEINNILFVFTSPNFESNDFLLIKSFNLKKFYLSNLILFVSIYDNIIFRKILHLKKRVKILFNSHFSSFNEKNILHFPIKSEYFEQNGIFINFKKVPQKSQKIVENITRSKSLLSIIFNFFPRTNNKFHYLNFFKENINNSFMFYESFFSDFYLKNIYINFEKYKVLKYFLKTIPNSSFDEFQKNSYNLKTSDLRLSSSKY